jgi:hypothetical protein
MIRSLLVLAMLAQQGCKHDDRGMQDKEKGRYCDAMKTTIQLLRGQPKEFVLGARPFVTFAVDYCSTKESGDLDAIDLVLVEGDPAKIDAELTRLEQTIEWSPAR